jgi:L-histidine N-alpha-methyltransferase
MNRELDAGLDLGAIRHEAIYRADWRRVEISARFLRRQILRVRPLEQTLLIEAGDSIMSEISRKFDLVELKRYLSCFGLETIRAFADEQQWYAVLLLRRRADEAKP